MTTEAFSRMQPFVLKALTAVKRRHCAEPNYAPAAPVADQIACPKCGGRLNYTVDTKGMTSARCASAGCVKWSLQ
ncbi:hypothetical protein AVME950_02365 [Acidovorax sp. SUPP950]|uniref:hypothetical protein n=1 Tax=Acidovorax sp. SUPP950 TaxID=511901 RepID=UPI0023D5EFDD|nr:hypothetical protein [Acidovorax sp. SUPP950]GKS73691.1 hypothetical protein AVME950_02365 [Acidovorax sp. SUPP950]